MNEVLKQRLVGALILVALGVIFWPIIFVEPERQPVGQQQSIPPQPKLSDVPVAPPTPSELRASPALEIDEIISEQDATSEAMDSAFESASDSDKRSSSTAASDEARSTTKTEPAPAVPASSVANRTEPPKPLSVDADGVPEAWILQVVSVSSEDKANALRDRLLQMNHKGYVKRVSSNGKTLYRVYIGPRFEQNKLDDIRPQIDAEFGVKSMILRYVP